MDEGRIDGMYSAHLSGRRSYQQDTLGEDGGWARRRDMRYVQYARSGAQQDLMSSRGEKELRRQMRDLWIVPMQCWVERMVGWIVYIMIHDGG